MLVLLLLLDLPPGYVSYYQVVGVTHLLPSTRIRLKEQKEIPHNKSIEPAKTMETVHAVPSRPLRVPQQQKKKQATKSLCKRSYRVTYVQEAGIPRSKCVHVFWSSKCFEVQAFFTGSMDPT